MWILYIGLLKYRRIDFISLSSISLNVSIIYREKDSNRLNLESTRFMSRHWNECHLYHWYQAFVCHDWNDHWRWKTGESWAKDLPDRKWLVTGVSAPIYKRDISLNRDQVYSPLGGSSHHGLTYTKSWSSMTTGWFRVPWLNGNLHDSIDDSWDWIPCSRSVALRRYALRATPLRAPLMLTLHIFQAHLVDHRKHLLANGGDLPHKKKGLYQKELAQFCFLNLHSYHNIIIS